MRWSREGEGQKTEDQRKRPPYDCTAQHPKIQVKASLHPCCEDSVVICREEDSPRRRWCWSVAIPRGMDRT
ncbi:Phosphatidylinositol 4-Phosphate 5-Kinase Type-1 Gamma [Manis pentadactyla]|nr:Phosphatidylinositol 4-Phosphate 5-Kinase Type-1 Gamma [Manis pentadactyla]